MEHSSTIESFVTTLYARINDGEVTAFDALISSAADVLGIGKDPAEWWDSPSTLLAAFKTQVSEMHAAGMTIQPQDSHSSQAGTVGWFADLPRIMLPDGSALETRVTGVCQQEGGAWRLVQWHISVGVSGGCVQ